MERFDWIVGAVIALGIVAIYANIWWLDWKRRKLRGQEPDGSPWSAGGRGGGTSTGGSSCGGAGCGGGGGGC